jgi:hypothetical protein
MIDDDAALKLLVLAHAASTLIMLGVILVIQLVHYPLFRYVGAEAYVQYERAHIGAITPLVLPLMLIELITGMILLLTPIPNVPIWANWLGFGLIVLIWGVTGMVNAPQHGILAGGFDPAVHQALVSSNWLRTLGWGARGALILWMLWGLLRGVS